MSPHTGTAIASSIVEPRTLKLGTRQWDHGEFAIMAVINRTPDSFFERDPGFGAALDSVSRAVTDGADIVDIGAESTKPGSARISTAEEMRRLIPVLKRLKDRLGVPISVDTYKAEVAERALELGAEIINDPSGLTIEPLLARAVSNHDAGLILNHMRGRPETWARIS